MGNDVLSSRSERSEVGRLVGGLAPRRARRLAGCGERGRHDNARTVQILTVVLFSDKSSSRFVGGLARCSQGCTTDLQEGCVGHNVASLGSQGNGGPETLLAGKRERRIVGGVGALAPGTFNVSASC